MGVPDSFLGTLVFKYWSSRRAKIPIVGNLTPNLRKSIYVVQIAIFCSFAGILIHATYDLT